MVERTMDIASKMIIILNSFDTDEPTEIYFKLIHRLMIPKKVLSEANIIAIQAFFNMSAVWKNILSV